MHTFEAMDVFVGIESQDVALTKRTHSLKHGMHLFIRSFSRLEEGVHPLPLPPRVSQKTAEHMIF